MLRRKRRKNHSILMVTPEAVPFAKAGGLGDAVSALAQELDRDGHDVRILMPRYHGIGRERLYRYPTPFSVRVGEDIFTTALYEGRLGDSSVVVYFIDHEDLYAREGIYGTSAGGYADNLKRFSLLSHAAFAIGPYIGWEAEVVHAHDWPTALVPVIARRRAAMGASRPASVLTIHNVGYQGAFPVGDLPASGLSWVDLSESSLLHYDSLNLLKAGTVNADMVTTVSRRYAEEIRTPRRGFSLDRVLAERGDTLVGILNGVDYDVWNPEKDPYLDVRYTAETVALKERSKRALQQELGLPVTNDLPLIGMVSRLVDQKGFEELSSPGFGALPDILEENDAQLAILGSGEERYEYYLRSLAHRYRNLSVVIGFDERLAHLIEAASDFFLMPSRYEPCGLNQLYSLRYGSLPIVTATGGLVDTVQQASPRGGTGFFIDEACPASIAATVGEAVTMWHDERNRIDAMRRAAMKLRFGWETAATAYVRVYERARGIAEADRPQRSTAP
ncbi:MAG: glycogen synthase [Spirochaetota bacterium]